MKIGVNMRKFDYVFYKSSFIHLSFLLRFVLHPISDILLIFQGGATKKDFNFASVFILQKVFHKPLICIIKFRLY